jgi:hypothetical protein
METALVAALVVIAFAAVAVPILRGRSGGAIDAASDAPVEPEIMRYREAVRADTVCRRCGQANPPGSRFCCECGRALASVDAQEFDGTGEAA